MATVLARETITSISTAVGITQSVAVYAKDIGDAVATVQVLGGNCRFTTDGSTTPVAGTTGHRLLQNGVVTLKGYTEIRGFKAVDDGGTAKLEVTITDISD